MLVFSCPSCGAKLQMSEDLAGKKVRCSSCQAVVAAPAKGAGDEAITAASPTAVAGGNKSHSVPADADAGDDREERRRTPRRDSGGATAAKAAGMSVGILLAIVGVVGCCVVTGVGGIIFALVFPAVGRVREAAARTQTMNNMKQIALAQHNYAGVHAGKLPNPKAMPWGPETVELSWRVEMLPYIEQNALYKQFDTKSAWNIPRNEQPSRTHVLVYDQILRDGADNKGNMTYFQYFTGEKTMWVTNNGKYKIGNIPDGTSNTFDFADAAKNVRWAEPANMVIQQGQPLPLPEDRFFVAMWDGSVHIVDRSRTPDATLRLYIDPEDGAAVPLID